MKKTVTSAQLLAALNQEEANRSCLLVHFIASSTGYLPVEPAKMASEISCPFCGCKEYFLHMVDKERRAWLCKRICLGSTLPNQSGSMDTPPKSFRAVLWPVWCQIQGIGDINYDIRFENVQQSQEKIAYMLKFVAHPRSILFMQGDKGAGKTYASLAMCELFTRRSTSCIFGTQKQIFDKWVASIRENCTPEYTRQVSEVNLLVIDDFGIGESTTAFMTFIMDLINTRLQWTNRGTVITTNLAEKEIQLLTSPAFMDRLNTGQHFEFREKKSRRKPTIL